MKRCLACNGLYQPVMDNCPVCGKSPVWVDGFQAYAPALAHSGGGFESSYFSELARLEGKNFWFRSRNRLIIWALKKYFPNFQSILEIGCGTGYVLSGLSNAFTKATLQGSEIFTAGLGFAAKRLPSATFMQMDARNIPFAEEFDVIGAFDVLEHIEEDERVLEQAHVALKPLGLMLITVPQHAWLWSSVDEYACHVRRYSAQELNAKLEAAGFEILRSTSFVSLLLPAMMISRGIQKKPAEKVDATAELKLPAILNKLFYSIMLIETFFIKWGATLPVGGSRLVVARKIS